MNNLLKNLCVLGIGAFCSVGCFSMAAHADSLSDIASPVSNPVNFEDPRIESNIRPIFVYHKLDNKFVTQGGDVRIVALQARLAVTDRLALIATKDGWVSMHPNAVLNDESGFANLAAGFKYALYQDKDAGQIVSAGLRYEIPTGEKEVLQGRGDGSINPFISAATTLCDYNLVAGTGFRFAIDNQDSSFYDLDLHIDRKFGWFSPLLELNLVHVVSAGDRLPIADEGQDFFNLGASGSTGENMLTASPGFRVSLADNVAAGVAYSFPLVHGAGSRVTDWRITTDVTVSF